VLVLASHDMLTIGLGQVRHDEAVFDLLVSQQAAPVGLGVELKGFLSHTEPSLPDITASDELPRLDRREERKPYSSKKLALRVSLNVLVSELRH